MMIRRKTGILLGFILVSVVGFVLLNLALGSVWIPLGSVWNILSGSESEPVVWQTIVLKSRLPQSFIAMLAGAALSISGLQMQTLFRNPLAGPSVLGISAGASLGVAFVVLASGTVAGVALTNTGFLGEVAMFVAAIVGALAVLFLIFFASNRVKGNVTLLIIGVMIGYVATAIIGVFKYFSADEDIRDYVIWGLGSFSRVSEDQLNLFVGLVSVAIVSSFLLVKTLNLLMLGDNYAQNLGLNLKRSRFQVILSSGILTALVTAYCGPINFLGLAVPHLCRAIFKTSDHRVLMPAVMITGAALALACNLIARMPGMEGALPINSVTALVGAPIVASIIFRKRKGMFHE